MKHCETCGAEVPVGAAYCARCGALAPQAFSEYGVSPSGATVASSSDAATQLSHNPYENPLSPPPPPPPPQWRFPLRLKIVMVGLILLLLIESGALYYLTAFRLNRPLTPIPVSTQPSSAATIQTLRATLTAVADPEGIYTQATSGLPV